MLEILQGPTDMESYRAAIADRNWLKLQLADGPTEPGEQSECFDDIRGQMVEFVPCKDISISSDGSYLIPGRIVFQTNPGDPRDQELLECSVKLKLPAGGQHSGYLTEVKILNRA